MTASAESGRADQVVMNDESHVGAKIVGLRDGRLQFHSADGSPHSVWLSDIGLIIVDRGGIFADFNQAERFAAKGETQRALVRYRRTQRLADAFWPELIDIRMLLTLDEDGQLNKAVAAFVRTLDGESTGPRAAARLLPRNVPDRPNSKVGRAIGELDKALARNPQPAKRALLEIVRYDILRRSNDKRESAAAHRVASLSIPKTCRSDEVYAVVLEASRRDLRGEVSFESLAGLDRAIRDCPRAVLPDYLLLKGRVLLRVASTREEIIRAAWPFMRTVIHFPDDVRAPDGLLGAALAVERLGRMDRAINLLQECLAHGMIPDETKSSASAALERLRAANKN